jgi:hypothetical protein
MAMIRSLLGLLACALTFFVTTGSDALAQAGASAATGKLSQAGYAWVATEFMTLAEIEATLPLLASHGVGIVLSWPADQLDDAAHFQLVQKAAAQGVEVRPCLVLSRADGYWASSTTAAVYDRYARRLIDAWLDKGLTPTTFEVDMEMPISRALQFAQLAKALDSNALIAFLQQGVNRSQYTSATRTYKDLVGYAHQRGFRVEVTTLAPMVDDYADGDDGLRQAFNVPLDGIPWDSVSVQLYRTLNEEVLGAVAGHTTSYYVYDYAVRARAIWGSKAAVGIGMTDGGELDPTAPVYTDGGQLRQDVDAASWAGIPRAQLGLYNLRGILRRPPSAQWFPDKSLVSVPPLPDVATVLTHASSAVLDAAL